MLMTPSWNLWTIDGTAQEECFGNMNIGNRSSNFSIAIAKTLNCPEERIFLGDANFNVGWDDSIWADFKVLKPTYLGTYKKLSMSTSKPKS